MVGRAECLVVVMACNLMTNISYLPTVHPYITPQPHRTYSLSYICSALATFSYIPCHVINALQFATFISIMLHFAMFQLMSLHLLDSLHGVQNISNLFTARIWHHSRCLSGELFQNQIFFLEIKSIKKYFIYAFCLIQPPGPFPR